MSKDIVIKGPNASDPSVTYAMLVASAGDKSPALFRDTASATQPVFQNMASVSASQNGSGNVRRVTTRFVYPITEVDEASNARQVGQIVANVTFSLPLLAKAVDAEKAAAYFGNLMASAALRQIHQTGYVPGDFTYVPPSGD